MAATRHSFDEADKFAFVQQRQPGAQQQNRGGVAREVFKRQIVSPNGDARQAREALEEEPRSDRVAAQAGILGIDVADRELHAEQVQHAPGESREQQQEDEPGPPFAHAATPLDGASAALSFWMRSRSSTVSPAETSCRPYQARSNATMLAAKSSLASGTPRARRRSSASYSRLVFPGWIVRNSWRPSHARLAR